jgi:glutathione S-transferase
VNDLPAEGSVLELTRTYAAPRDEVFRAFTVPALVRQWLKPKTFTIEEFDFSPTVGRRYRVALRSPDGVRYAHEGEFLRVSAPVELVYTWRWVEGPLPGNDTLVEVRLSDAAGGTLVHVRHSGFVSDAVRDRHIGWVESLDYLAGWLARRP